MWPAALFPQATSLPQGSRLTPSVSLRQWGSFARARGFIQRQFLPNEVLIRKSSLNAVDPNNPRVELKTNVRYTLVL